MRLIYHLVPRDAWDQAPPGSYTAPSLASEGFIHCSNRDQVAWAANKFYADQPALLVLTLDAARLTSPLKDEDPGMGQTFPHIYGPINRDAIVSVDAMQRGPEGRWQF